MKYKDIGSWRIKGKPMFNILMLECFVGNKEAKLNHFAWLSDYIGRVRTLKDGEEVYRQLCNDMISFGIWLRENDLVKLNIKVKEKKGKEKPSMFG